MAQNNFPGWKVATYREVHTVNSQVSRGELYRLVVPIAVRHTPRGIEVVEPVWSQCYTPRSWCCSSNRYCAVYYPPDIDAVVYLRIWYDFWRDVEVRCDCGDAEFCRQLRQVAEELWRRPLSPEDVAAALASTQI